MLDLVAAMAAAALQTATPSERYSVPATPFDRRVAGWTIIRRPDGCIMYHDRRPGLTATSIHYKIGDGTPPSLAVTFSNPAWHLPTQQARGYRIDFTGVTGSDWDDLTAYSFRENAETDGRGFVVLGITAQGIAPLLTDITRASGLTLWHEGRQVGGTSFPRGTAAARRLLDCVGTLGPRPSIPGI